MMYFVKDWKWIKLCLNWIPETMLCSLYCIKKPVQLLQFSFLQRCIKKTLKSPCQIVFLCRIWWVFLGRKFSILQTSLNPTSPLFTYRRLCVCVCSLYISWPVNLSTTHLSKLPTAAPLFQHNLSKQHRFCVCRQTKMLCFLLQKPLQCSNRCFTEGWRLPTAEVHSGIQTILCVRVYVCVCVCTDCSEGELTNWLSVFY